jgi:Glycosyl transferase family 2
MRLSVVVTIVDAGDTLERCLSALSRQQESITCDVIVPWDDTVDGIPAVEKRYPSFQFLAMGHVDTTRLHRSFAGQHELFDRRRSAGLRAARGDVVAILEDRCVPQSDWMQTMVSLHERLPHAVIGGAIENGRDTPLHWAVFLCDFGRYQRPFEAGSRKWVSDVNVGYKRRALDQTRQLWEDRYHETTVHWALMRAGETLFLAPELVVHQVRGPLSLTTLLTERFAWGRVFAYTRAREVSLVKRVGFIALTPLLPLLLLSRQIRQHLSSELGFGPFAAASPYLFLMFIAWSLGEALGYATAEP